MRKRLFFTLLIISTVVVAGAVLLAYFLTGPGESGKTVAIRDLSFKPFTTQELLNFDIEIDTETCGEVIDDPDLRDIEDRVVELRELPLENPVEFVAMSEPCLRYQLEEDLSEEDTQQELNSNEKLLVALGLIPPDEDLEETITDVYSEQIAGAYDPEVKQIIIMEGEKQGKEMEEVTTAHEITHVLQDQNFRLLEPPLDDDGYNGDNSLAVESLIEGDATLTMLLYAQEYCDIEKLLEEEYEATELSSEALEEAPDYIEKSLLFPYEQGMIFVDSIVTIEGWEALDEAFRDPPMSTEQIMHPEKYKVERDDPRPVPLADISPSLGEGWSKIAEECMGEFDVKAWFEEFCDRRESKEVAEGWDGNTIQYYQGPLEDDYVMVNMFVWDSTEEAQEFYREYEVLLEERFGDDLEKAGEASGSYLYEADGELFYCGISGDATLCVQVTGDDLLMHTLQNFAEFPGPAG